MDTINNDIFRFDNQYLKCIVTKYPSVLENNGYLANSGAMIIYQPQSETNQTYKNVDESYRRNYMYLGNEFLASGYGFLCKEMRNDAENIVKNYNTTINNLINKDNELNNKIDSNIENIQTELEDNYIKKTGSITSTFININGQDVSTKDMLIYGEEAKYKNLEVTDIKIRINNGDWFTYTDDAIYEPIGLPVSRIDVKVYYDRNDTGGINKIEVLHDKAIFGLDDEEFDSVVINYNLENDMKSNFGVIHYSKIYDEKIYITEEMNLIKGFNIYVSKTPVVLYKNYPRLEEALGIEIKSTGNIIDDNVITIIKDMKVIPQYQLYYNFATNNDVLNYNLIEENSTLIKDNIISLPGNSNSSILYFALPSIYKIDNLYALDNNYDKYNWTGAVLKKSSPIQLRIYKNDGGTEYVTNYILYKLNDSKNFTCSKINIEISIKENVSNNISELPSDRQLFDFNDNININNEFFNTLYWVEFTNESEDTINSRLNRISKNCS